MIAQQMLPNEKICRNELFMKYWGWAESQCLWQKYSPSLSSLNHSVEAAGTLGFPLPSWMCWAGKHPRSRVDLFIADCEIIFIPIGLHSKQAFRFCRFWISTQILICTKVKKKNSHTEQERRLQTLHQQQQERQADMGGALSSPNSMVMIVDLHPPLQGQI